MATVINASLWEYFTKTDDYKKVICKFCNKLLDSKRNFNLKVHLKQSHKIPIYTEKKPRSNIALINKIKRLEQRLVELKELESSNCGPTSNENTNEQHNSEFEIDETIVKSDYEIIQQDTTANEASFEYGDDMSFDDNNADVSTRNSTDPQLITTILPDITEPSPNFKKNDPPREPVRTKKAESQPQKKRKTASISDPLEEEPDYSSKDDNFDQWAHKKEKLMHLEYIEMRNYKFKLELWEKEQQLRLASSKYTRDLRNNPL